MNAVFVFFLIVALLTGLVANMFASSTRRRHIILIDDVPTQPATGCGTALAVGFILLVVLIAFNVSPF